MQLEESLSAFWKCIVIKMRLEADGSILGCQDGELELAKEEPWMIGCEMR